MDKHRAEQLQDAIDMVAAALLLSDVEKYDETKWDAFISNINRSDIFRLATKAGATP